MACGHDLSLMELDRAVEETYGTDRMIVKHLESD